MDRSAVQEFHYITPIADLASIRSHGLLSHELARRFDHKSVADDDVQRRRAQKSLPNGKRLHEYVNLFFHCRNPMMSRLTHNGVTDIVVLCISPEAMDIPGSIVADGNAASSGTLLDKPSSALAELERKRVFAQSWDSDDHVKKTEYGRQRSAELLIPDRLDISYVIGYYVHQQSQITECRMTVPDWQAKVQPYVFFR